MTLSQYDGRTEWWPMSPLTATSYDVHPCGLNGQNGNHYQAVQAGYRLHNRIKTVLRARQAPCSKIVLLADCWRHWFEWSNKHSWTTAWVIKVAVGQFCRYRIGSVGYFINTISPDWFILLQKIIIRVFSTSFQVIRLLDTYFTSNFQVINFSWSGIKNFRTPDPLIAVLFNYVWNSRKFWIFYHHSYIIQSYKTTIMTSPR